MCLKLLCSVHNTSHNPKIVFSPPRYNPNSELKALSRIIILAQHYFIDETLRWLRSTDFDEYFWKRRAYNRRIEKTVFSLMAFFSISFYIAAEPMLFILECFFFGGLFLFWLLHTKYVPFY